MSHRDKVMEIYNRLKGELEEKGLIINNDKGAANVIIIALSEAFYDGIEKGELSGKLKTLDLLDEKISELKS